MVVVHDDVGSSASDWCAEQFSTDSFVVRTEITRHDPDGLFLGDRWHWATVFRFKNSVDAAMFTMRWA